MEEDDEESEYQSTDLPDRPHFYPQVEFNEKPESLFFNDGVRRIDFILVYEDEDKKEFEKRSMYMRRKVKGFTFSEA